MRVSLYSLLILLGGRALCSEVRIHNTEELIELSTNVSKGTNYEGTTVFLDSDIDLSGKSFEPIGNTINNHFKGIFDGQGHTISNLKISSASEDVGLFGYSSGITIKNVVIDSSCSISNSLASLAGSVYIGGIIGYCESTYNSCIITNIVNMGRAFFNGNRDGEEMCLGGIIGEFYYYEYEVVIKNCANYNSISHTGMSGYTHIGGIAGYLRGNSKNLGTFLVQNCLNHGSIIFKGTADQDLYIGGIIGYGESTSIDNCVNSGAITSNATSNTYIGGLIGFVQTISISHCLWTRGVGYENAVNGTENFNIISSSLITSFNTTTISELNEYAEKKDSTWSRWVMLHLNGGSVNNLEQDAPIGGLLKSLPIPVKEGEPFLFWCKDEECNEEYNPEATEMRGISNLYAKWLLNNYTITFDGNGGTPSKTAMIVTYNSTYGDLPTATKTGYTFMGWHTEEVGGEEITSTTTFKLTNNQALYAHWLINQYTVTFNFNNGTEITSEFRFDDTIEYPEDITEKEGHTFYWAPKPERMPAQNIITKIEWLPNNYTVTFNGNGEIPSKTAIVVTYNSTYGDLPTANKTGYTFLGWFTEEVDGEEVTKETSFKLTNNQTLYAHWLINQYTITFNFNNGTEITSEFTFNDTITYPEDITRDGYTFNGWTPKPERMGAQNINTWAQWNEESEYIEIVIGKKDMKEEEIKEIIEKYADVEDFKIERFESDEETGETRVIIKFIDKDKATSFIDNVSASSETRRIIKTVGFIEGIGSFSSPANLLFFAYYFF